MDKIKTANFRAIEGTKLYRSSKPEVMTLTDINALIELGVKVILDFRSPSSFENKNKKIDPVLLDSYYTPYKVHTLKGEIEYDIVFENLDNSKSVGNHFYVNMIDAAFAYKLIRGLPLIQQLYFVGLGVGYLLGSDLIMREITRYGYVAPGETMVLTQYKTMVKYTQPRIQTSLELLSRSENCPALLCCALGKDRTGMMAAILQLLCGVDKAKVSHDYALSQNAMEQLLREDETLEDTFRHRFALDDTLLQAEADTMDKLTEFIEEIGGGSLQGFLDKIGVDEITQEKLINNIKLKK